jgi:hypothetical protein
LDGQLLNKLGIPLGKHAQGIIQNLKKILTYTISGIISMKASEIVPNLIQKTVRS